MSFLTMLSVLIGASTSIAVQADKATQSDAEKPKKFDAKETYKPTPVPDRIILTLTVDPATKQSVTWRSIVSDRAGVLEYAKAEGGPKFVRKLKRIKAETKHFTSDLGDANYHSVTMQNLEPNTQYLYRVGDGVNWSEFSQFKTASNESSPFSFIYFGDSQNDLKSHWSRVVREAFKEAPHAAFLLHAGDLVNTANSDRDWGEWFYSGGWINRTMPSMATPGNHEYSKSELSRHWRTVFALPENGPKGLEETVYSFVYQDTRVVSLNSNKMLNEQAKWLDRLLQENKTRWTIVTMHHPIFSTAKDRDNTKVRETFQPLFDKYKVDLVLTGHDHTYGRTGMRNASQNVIYDNAVDKEVEEKERLKKAKEAKEKADKEKADKENGGNTKNDNRTADERLQKHILQSQADDVHQHAVGDHRHDGWTEDVKSRMQSANVSTGLRYRSQESGTVYVVSVSGPKMYKLKAVEFFEKTAQDTQLYQVISIDGDKLSFSAHTATGKLYDQFVLQKKSGQPNQMTTMRDATQN